MAGKKGQKWIRDKDNVPNNPKYKKAKEDIAEMLRKGYLINEIFAEVLLEIPELNDIDFQRMVRSSYEDIKLTIHRNREYIFKLHMDRYENTYRSAIEMIGRDQRVLIPKTDWHEMVGRYIVALKALKHKEDLLGLHNKDVVIEINENDAQIKMPDKVGKAPFTVERLNDEEIIELLSLLRTARVSEEDGVRRLVIKQSPLQLLTQAPQQEEEVVDVIYEELPEKVVDKIQTVTEVVEPNEADANVIDARDPAIINTPRKTMEQVRSDLKSNALEQFKEMLKNRKEPKMKKPK